MESQISKISGYSDSEMQKYLLKADISFLHELKLFLDDKYYNTGEDPGLNDYQYDMLKEILVKRDPGYTPPIGSKIRTGDNKITLPFWLGSMNKLKPEDESELKRWIDRNKSNEYIIEDKLDGISCLLSINNGKIKLYTRGDGVVGSDISYLAPYFKNIPDIRDIKDLILRGELIMNYHTFQEKYAEEFANPRNFVAGRTGSKTVRKGLEDIDFIAYEIVGKGIMVKPADQLEFLSSIGFKVVNNTVVAEITKEILLERFLLSKQESGYEIDGIIILANVPYIRNVSGNPGYAFAFKVRLESNLIPAEVEEVEWNISKWGLIKPRIRIKPVSLSGVTITYTSGFNAKYIHENNIGPGTIIKLTRSGDVIPFIVEVVKSTFPQMPDIPYKWNDTRVDIFTEENDNIMCVKLIASFFSSLKIKHVSDATVSKMYEYGLDSIIKILSADKEDFEQIEGFGKRLAERTYDNIHEGLQNISLHTLLGASGIFGMGIGSRKLETLLNNIPDILDIYIDMPKDELYEMINNVDGFSDKTTTRIVENLPWASKFIKSVEPYIKIKTKKKNMSDLNELKAVFSGFRDKDLEEKVKQRGGKVVTSVSKNTTALVVADKYSSSSKITKAREMGIDIFDKDEFVEFFSL
jgi:DNA ligase (NAD+)